MQQERFYRKYFARDWFSYEVILEESDLLVKSKNPLDKELIYRLLKRYRAQIKDYIARYPEFRISLSSFALKEPAPLIVKEMVEKTSLLEVGPMASVAGAIAEFLGEELLKFSEEVIVENGGDIFIKKKGNILLGLYAGGGSFINNLTFQIENEFSSLGICSSSSFLGPSLSLGAADLTMVVSDSAVFSDALATKLANMVCREEDIKEALDYALKLPYRPRGLLLLKRERVGLWGAITIKTER